MKLPESGDGGPLTPKKHWLFAAQTMQSKKLSEQVASSAQKRAAIAARKQRLKAIIIADMHLRIGSMLCGFVLIATGKSTTHQPAGNQRRGKDFMSASPITAPLPQMLRMLAGIVIQAKLQDGRRVLDASDMKEWLEELAKSAEGKQ